MFEIIKKLKARSEAIAVWIASNWLGQSLISSAPEHIRDLDLISYSETGIAALQVNVALQEVEFMVVYWGPTVAVLSVPLWVYNCINVSTR